METGEIHFFQVEGIDIYKKAKKGLFFSQVKVFISLYQIWYQQKTFKIDHAIVSLYSWLNVRSMLLRIFSNYILRLQSRGNTPCSDQIKPTQKKAENLSLLEKNNLSIVKFIIYEFFNDKSQCWTEGRSSTAVAEGFRPTATATVAEVWDRSYGQRSYW